MLGVKKPPPTTPAPPPPTRASTTNGSAAPVPPAVPPAVPAVPPPPAPAPLSHLAQAFLDAEVEVEDPLKPAEPLKPVEPPQVRRDPKGGRCNPQIQIQNCQSTSSQQRTAQNHVLKLTNTFFFFPNSFPLFFWLCLCFLAG